MPQRHHSHRRGLVLLGTVIGVVVLVSCGTSGRSRHATPTATLVPLPTLDAGAVALGRQIYLANCARCHGVNAQGAPNWQQPDARGNLPPPPHNDSGHTWRHSDTELTQIILHGLRDPFNKTPELTMPPFAGKLTTAQVAAVITYFKSLWSPAHRHYQEEQNRQPLMPMATPGGRQ